MSVKAVKRKSVATPTAVSSPTTIAADRDALEGKIDMLQWTVKEILTLVRLLYSRKRSRK